jgi:hypothetical protein
VNRLIRNSTNTATGFASNTSIGSTNNLLGTPGGGQFENKQPSPNLNTFDQNSNPSLSPNTDLIPGASLYQNKRILIGPNGYPIQTRVVSANDNFSANDYKRSSSMITPSNSSTPIREQLNKMGLQNSLNKGLVNNLTPCGANKQQNRITPINHHQRLMTPNQFMVGANNIGPN